MFIKSTTILAASFVSASAFAGQGFLINVNTSLEGASTSVTSNDNFKSGSLSIAGNNYFEVDDGFDYLVLKEDATLEFSVYNAGNAEIASYTLTVSNATGIPSITNNSVSDGYVQSAQLFPSAGLGTQYHIEIAVQNFNPSTWMGDMASKIEFVRLMDGYFPGTHDTGTYDISETSAETADASDALGLGEDLALTKSYIVDWSIAQTDTALEQLQSGVRYLDIRVSDLEDSDAYVAAHALAGAPISDIIDDVKTFINTSGNDKEIIIMDFNHWYSFYGDDNIPTMVANVMDELNDAFGDKIAPRQNFSPTNYYSDFWYNNKQVIICVDSDYVNENSFAWRSVNTGTMPSDEDFEGSVFVYSYWPDQQTASGQIAQLTEAFQQVNNYADRNFLFVAQGQLTPDLSVNAEGLNPFGSQASNLAEFTGTYRATLTDFFANQLNDFPTGVVFLEDYSKGIDLTGICIARMTEPSGNALVKSGIQALENFGAIINHSQLGYIYIHKGSSSVSSVGKSTDNVVAGWFYNFSEDTWNWTSTKIWPSLYEYKNSTGEAGWKYRLHSKDGKFVYSYDTGVWTKLD